MLSGGEYQIIEKEDNANGDGGIGKVEHRPGTNVYKISHLALEDSVYQVAHSATEEQPQGYLGQHSIKQRVA